MAPTDVYHRVSSYIRGTKEKEDPLPILTTTTAAVLSISYTVIYVFPFYLSRTTRPSPSLSRDAPSVIRARIRFVSASVVAATLSTFYTLHVYAGHSIFETLRLLGWYPIGVSQTAKVLLLICILFVGPLFERGIAESKWRDWIQGKSLRESLSSWIGWRNFVAGPITEELTFRSLMIPLHLLALVPPIRMVLLTPLYFGIAHIHHFYEFTLTHPHTPMLPTLLRSVIQFTYTTLFGWFATFVFLRTGSVFAVILAHSFCNWAGLPRVWGRIESSAFIGPVGRERPQRGKEDQDKVQVAGGRLGVQWTVAYYVLLVAGAVGFYEELWPLTESKRGLATI